VVGRGGGYLAVLQGRRREARPQLRGVFLAERRPPPAPREAGLAGGGGALLSGCGSQAAGLLQGGGGLGGAVALLREGAVLLRVAGPQHLVQEGEGGVRVEPCRSLCVFHLQPFPHAELTLRESREYLDLVAGRGWMGWGHVFYAVPAAIHAAWRDTCMHPTSYAKHWDYES